VQESSARRFAQGTTSSIGPLCLVTSVFLVSIPFFLCSAWPPCLLVCFYKRHYLGIEWRRLSEQTAVSEHYDKEATRTGIERRLAVSSSVSSVYKTGVEFKMQDLFGVPYIGLTLSFCFLSQGIMCLFSFLE
jgi:hypothetical protein